MSENKKNQINEENLPQAESMQKKNKTWRILVAVLVVVMIIGGLGDALGDIGAVLGIIISVVILKIFFKNRAK